MSKPKMLLIGDDIRMHSGVATQLRELTLGIVDEYDIVLIAGDKKIRHINHKILHWAIHRHLPHRHVYTGDAVFLVIY